MNKFYSEKKIVIFFSLISFVFLSYLLGLKNINPLNTTWIPFQDDFLSYHLAWKFYSDSNWTWPLTSNPNYGLEVTTNIFYSDNVEILNILLKPIKKILNIDFQFITIWQIICIKLQLYFSYKILFYKTRNFFFSLICSFLFSINPFFLDRLFAHISLAAHWILLWAIYLQLRYDFKKSFNNWIFLFIVSIFINVNLAFIIILFFYSYFLYLILLKKFSTKYILEKGFISLSTIVFSLYIAGFFEISAYDYFSFGFGYYKSNLLTFFDPKGGILNHNWSLLINDIHNFPGESEGFGYFGISFLFFLVFFIFKDFFSTNKYRSIFGKNKIFYIIISFIFIIWAFTNVISFGENKILEIDLNKFLFAILSIFRAPGRFIWLPIYLLLFFMMIYMYKNFNKRYINFFVAFIFLFQFYDQTNAFKSINYNFNKKNIYNIQDKIFWKKIPSIYPNLNTTFILSDMETLKSTYTYLVNNNFKATNINMVSRIDKKKMSLQRYKNYKNFLNKDLDPNTIYWIHPQHHTFFFHNFYDDPNFLIFKDNKEFFILKKKKSLDFTSKSIDDKISPKLAILNKKINPWENRKYFGLGWFVTGSFWSDGNYSTILFSKNKDIKKLKLFCNIFNYNEETIKNFEFFINDIKLTEVSFSKNNSEDIIEILFNQSLLNKDNIFTIKNNNNTTRLDLKIYPDPRILGLKLNHIIFE